jgi:sulfur-oxidizing protein SoxX
MTAKMTNVWGRRCRRMLGIGLSAAALQACATGWGQGFHLPEGDANRGREAFVDLRCNVCHEIKGFDPPSPIVAETRVLLGGRTVRVKTYGDLLTAIVNPSHRLARGYPSEATTINGESVMSLIYLNELMTVQQLIDMVAFLQSEYEVVSLPIQWEVYPSTEAAAGPSPAPLTRTPSTYAP